MNENNIHLRGEIQRNIKEELEALKNSFEYYFPTAQGNTLGGFKWVQNGFSVNRKWSIFNSVEYEVLSYLKSHKELKTVFQNQVYQSFDVI